MKQSGFMKKQQKAKTQESTTAFLFGHQLTADIVQIVLHQEFGWGHDRMARFVEALSKRMNEVLKVWNSDAKDVEYTKAKIDQALMQFAGEDFTPWEERYRF